MIRAGLTGGMACGKSFVGNILQELGCHVVRADDLGRQVMAPGGAAFEPIVQNFGRQVVQENGQLDRKRLAAIVFGDPAQLALLNSLVHPAVFQLEDAFLDAAERQDPTGIAIVEAAILIETGRFRHYDRLIVVWCTEEQQLSRAMQREGCTEAEARARLKRQMPVEEKRKFADYLIDASGSEQQTVRQTYEVYASLRADASQVTPESGQEF